MELDREDLKWAVQRLPLNLKTLMNDQEWSGKIFVGGGYLRSVIANELVNDVDVFVATKERAELLAYKLCNDKRDVIKTNNAYTIKGRLPIQVIHRWTFDKMEDVSNSFDFTICCAVFSCVDKKYESYCDNRFYLDVAAKRLIYRSPLRNEDAGGSMLRVLKYYQKGYRIPLNSLGAVVARLVKDIDTVRQPINDELGVAKIVTGLLREVDPNIDPLHISHLPSTDSENGVVEDVAENTYVFGRTNLLEDRS